MLFCGSLSAHDHVALLFCLDHTMFSGPSCPAHGQLSLVHVILPPKPAHPAPPPPFPPCPHPKEDLDQKSDVAQIYSCRGRQAAFFHGRSTRSFGQSRVFCVERRWCGIFARNYRLFCRLRGELPVERMPQKGAASLTK